MKHVPDIPRYEIRDFLGRGAVGDVHRAFDSEIGRQVALKWIRKKGADPDALEAERHGAELQKQVAAIAPQVAAVYDIGETNDVFYVAMELIEGRDLTQVLQEDAPGRVLALERTTSFVFELCDLLETFHQFSTTLSGRRIAGVVHGDIKPDNVRIQSDDRLRMLDFGIAKHLSSTRRSTRNLFGSLPYTPPERLRTGMVDPSSDLWAVGTLLYILVGGQSPYAERGHERLERAIKDGPPRPLPSGVPEPLRAVVEQATAFSPEDRFESAAELRRALEEAVERCRQEGLTLAPVPAAAEPVESGGEDEATRRTVEPAERGVGAPDEATRRTAPPPQEQFAQGPTRRTGVASQPTAPTAGAAAYQTLPPAASRALPPTPPVPESEAAPTTRRKRPRWLTAAAVVFLLLQVQAQRSASTIVDTLSQNTSPDVEREWQRYRSAAWLRPFDIGLWKAKRRLDEALVADAERVIAGFRTDTPTVTSEEWRRARRSLQSSLRIGPEDRVAEARLAYVEAHLDRLEGRRQRRKGNDDRARERLERSRYGFERAATLDEEWADPYLGLARIAAYEDFDLEQLLVALRGALSRGYPWGRRERAQLADANHTRANQLLLHARESESDQSQAALLREARRHLVRAIQEYERILDFGNARPNRDVASQRLRELEERLRLSRRASWETEWS